MDNLTLDFFVTPENENITCRVEIPSGSWVNQYSISGVELKYVLYCDINAETIRSYDFITFKGKKQRVLRVVNGLNKGTQIEIGR